MSAILRLLVGSAAVLLATVARAETGTVWSLDQNGRQAALLGTWVRQGGVALVQGPGFALALEVNLQQPLANAVPQIPVFIAYSREAVRRPSNFFSSPRPMVGPPGQAYGRRPNLRDWQRIPRGELALDLRTLDGQSIDGLWRPVEVAPVSTYGRNIAATVGAWQRIRIVFAPLPGPAGHYRFTPHAF